MFLPSPGGMDAVAKPAFCGPCGLRLRARCWRFGPDPWPVYICAECIKAALARKPE